MKYLIVLGLVLVGCGKDAEPELEAQVTGTLSCAGTQTVNSISLVFLYDLVTYSNGDKLVSCSVSDTAHQYGNTRFLKSGQFGESTGQCLLIYDVDSANTGFWTFTSAKTAVYENSGSSSHGTSVTLSCLVDGV